MTQPIKYKGIDDFDKIVQETISQFLPLEALTNSAVTDKFFQKMMDNKHTWEKVAKQFNIKPKSQGTAKSEVITRLRANQRFLEIFQNSFGRDVSHLKKLEPVAQNKAIAELLGKSIQESNEARRGYGRSSTSERYFEDIVRKITEESGTKKGVDPIDIEVARMFIQQGSLFSEMGDWEHAFGLVIGVKTNRDNTYSYCPEHLVLFEELIKALKANSDPYLEDHKEDIVKNSLRYVWIDRFDRDTNYPYNFIEAALQSGIVSAERCFEDAIEYCPNDLWIKEGSPITQLLKYATPAEKTRVLQQSQTWFTELKEEVVKNLNDKRITHPGVLDKSLLRLVQWPVLTALLQNNEVNEKERQANIEWVNKQIDEAEAQAKDRKEFYDSLRAKVKELIQK